MSKNEDKLLKLKSVGDCDLTKRIPTAAAAVLPFVTLRTRFWQVRLFARGTMRPEKTWSGDMTRSCTCQSKRHRTKSKTKDKTLTHEARWGQKRHDQVDSSQMTRSYTWQRQKTKDKDKIQSQTQKTKTRCTIRRSCTRSCSCPILASYHIILHRKELELLRQKRREVQGRQVQLFH